MPLLKVEAEKLSANHLLAGVVEEIINVDQLFQILPFSQVNGKALIYNREKTISEAAFIDPNETVTEGAATFDEITTKLRVLAGDVDVDKFLDATMGDTNAQRATQILEKVKGIGNKFRRTLILGDATTNPKEFDGIDKISDATGNVIDAAGASLTLSALDELVDSIPGGGMVLVMNRRTHRTLKALHRLAGGNTGADLQMSNFGVAMPMHDGTPIVLNDYIPTTANKASIYAIRINEVDGLHGLYGGSNAGVAVEDLGTVQNKDATRTRVKWYCGLALKSTKSLAKIKNVTV